MHLVPGALSFARRTSPGRRGLAGNVFAPDAPVHRIVSSDMFRISWMTLDDLEASGTIPRNQPLWRPQT